jgi:hypothetical protein
MAKHLIVLFASSLLALALIGCGPRWQIVAQATPNPMSASSKFFVEPLHFENLIVGGKNEDAYQATKSPEQQASWKSDKDGMAAEFANGYSEERDAVGVAASPAGAFTVRPHITFIEPGFNIGIASHPAEVRINVQILNEQNAVVDEFTISSSTNAYATGTRVRIAAKDLGVVTARYMKARTGQN